MSGHEPSIGRPFSGLSGPILRRWFRVLLLATVLWTLLLSWVDLPLRSAEAPNGIVSFELAASLSRVQAILDSWSPAERLFAAFSLGLDYVYLGLYSTTLAMGYALLARPVVRDAGSARNPWLSRLVPFVAYSLWLAALLDALENGCLFAVLTGQEDALWPAAAAGFAYGKFALLAVGVAAVLVAGLARVRRSVG